jgi:predicted nuclease of predicted toxin-antitoxin system
MVKTTTPDDEWFELSHDLWLEPGEKRQQVRLLADHNVPQSLVEEIRANGITVKTAQELRLARLADAELLTHAKREGLILLTLDGGFWSDKTYPIHQSGGIIFVDVRTSASAKASMGLQMLFLFAKSFGGNWRTGLKARATSDKFDLKMISYTGKKAAYEVRLRKNTLYARETIPSA